MTENVTLTFQELQTLARHLTEWKRWRQYQDSATADKHWDRFIEKSREKAQWQAGLATEVDHWVELHDLHQSLMATLSRPVTS